MKSPLIKPTDWIDYGQWVQPPLSGTFWCYWDASKALHKCVPRLRLHHMAFLDGHTLMRVADRAHIQQLATRMIERNTLEAFTKRFDMVAKESERAHLRLLNDSSVTPEAYIARLFATYQELAGLWWFAIVCGDALQTYSLEHGCASSPEALLEIVQRVRRPTWLEKQAQEVRGIARKVRAALPGVVVTDLTATRVRAVPELARVISRHVHTFAWFGTHHWMGEAYSVEQCVEHVREELARQGRVTGRVRRSIGGDKHTQALWHVLAAMTYWRTHLAECTAKVVFHSRGRLTECAARLHMSYDDLTQLSHKEILELLRGVRRKALPNIQERRRAYGCVVYARGGEQIMVGARLQTLLKPFIPVASRGETIRGMAASRHGVVIGTVKIIIAPKDFVKFTRGDILVVPETTPDFVPCMRIARAVVTDAGGVTSHAAIISRELGIPCVVGTKVATHALRDGDAVEVDSEAGTVRLIAARD